MHSALPPAKEAGTLPLGGSGAILVGGRSADARPSDSVLLTAAPVAHPGQPLGQSRDAGASPHTVRTIFIRAHNRPSRPNAKAQVSGGFHRQPSTAHHAGRVRDVLRHLSRAPRWAGDLRVTGPSR